MPLRRVGSDCFRSAQKKIQCPKYPAPIISLSFHQQDSSWWVWWCQRLCHGWWLPMNVVSRWLQNRRQEVVTGIFVDSAVCTRTEDEARAVIPWPPGVFYMNTADFFMQTFCKLKNLNQPQFIIDICLIMGCSIDPFIKQVVAKKHQRRNDFMILDWKVPGSQSFVKASTGY